MSPLMLSRGIQALGIVLGVIGIGGLVVSLALSGGVKGQVEGLERLETGVADTLDDAAAATGNLARELDNVRPILDDTETFLLRDVSGTLQAASDGLDTIETGINDARPILGNLQAVLKEDTIEILDSGIAVVGSGDAMLNEITGPASSVARFATNAERELESALGESAAIPGVIDTARADLRTLDIHPLVVTARDVLQASSEVEAFARSMGVQADAWLLREHALHLEQQQRTYWLHPTATYHITHDDLRALAADLDAAVSQLGLPIDIDTDLLRREADLLERHGRTIQLGVDPALLAADATLANTIALAETEVLPAVNATRGTVETMSGELENVHAQFPVAARFLQTLKDESLVLANTVSSADTTVGNAGEDLASVSAGLRDMQAQIEDLGGAVQVGHDVVQVGEQNLSVLSDGLAANAQDVRTLQSGQMITQTADWLVWYMVLTYVLFLVVGAGLFATGFTLSRIVR